MLSEASRPTLCFGEVLLRLTPQGAGSTDDDTDAQLLSANQFFSATEPAGNPATSPAAGPAAYFEAWWGGSEANVAVGLASLQNPVALLTALPSTPLGDSARAALEQQGVTVLTPRCSEESTAFDGAQPQSSRLGLYFTSTQASGKTVHYDRSGSAFSLQPPSPQDVPWANYGHFHTSGISPALSGACRRATLELLRAAKDNQLSTSFDLNLRKQLWSDQAAGRAVRQMLPFIDLLFAHAGQLASAFNLSPINLLEPQGVRSVVREFCSANGPQALIVTDRDSRAYQQSPGEDGPLNCGANGHPQDCSHQVRLMAHYYDSQEEHACSTPWAQFADRSGSGDSLAAGFLAGLNSAQPVEECLRQGLAAASLANQSEGDLPTFSHQEVKERHSSLFEASPLMHKGPKP